MNSKATDSNVLEAGNPDQTGTNTDGDAIAGKRKYESPRCYRLMAGQTRGKIATGVESAYGFATIGPS